MPAPIPGDPYYTSAIAPLVDDVLFHWPLQETSGTVAEDSSPAGRNGSYQDGPLLAQSASPLPPYPLFVSLDGGTIETSGLDLGGTQNYSASLWMRFDSASGNSAIIAQSDGTRDQEIRLVWFSSGTLAIQREVVVTRTASYTVASGYDPETAHHVAFTYDGSTLSLYVNGALRSDIPDDRVSDPYTTPIEVGSASIFGAPDGLDVCGVTLFDRALTPTEITSIYTAGVS
ncbi:MAG: LamG domain-containing protein [Myxococcota bacterium]|nr:LamG domain-containing protein [Myxococcota bacterium]